MKLDPGKKEPKYLFCGRKWCASDTQNYQITMLLKHKHRNAYIIAISRFVLSHMKVCC